MKRLHLHNRWPPDENLGRDTGVLHDKFCVDVPTSGFRLCGWLEISLPRVSPYDTDGVIPMLWATSLFLTSSVWLPP